MPNLKFDMSEPLNLSAAILVVLALSAFAQENTVTGTAMYMERIALPPDAVFEAELQDISRADAKAESLGVYRKENPGNPPFSFSIPYDPARVEPNHRYAVRATVKVGGNLRFTSDRIYPVLTMGNGPKVTEPIRMRGVGSPTPRSFISEPATFAGEGMRLNLFPDHTYYLELDHGGQPVTSAAGPRTRLRRNSSLRAEWKRRTRSAWMTPQCSGTPDLPESSPN
jgi:uncharacterized lipoprotein YbaY